MGLQGQSLDSFQHITNTPCPLSFPRESSVCAKDEALWVCRETNSRELSSDLSGQDSVTGKTGAVEDQSGRPGLYSVVKAVWRLLWLGALCRSMPFLGHGMNGQPGLSHWPLSLHFPVMKVSRTQVMCPYDIIIKKKIPWASNYFVFVWNHTWFLDGKKTKLCLLIA